MRLLAHPPFYRATLPLAFIFTSSFTPEPESPQPLCGVHVATNDPRFSCPCCVLPLAVAPWIASLGPPRRRGDRIPPAEGPRDPGTRPRNGRCRCSPPDPCRGSSQAHLYNTARYTICHSHKTSALSYYVTQAGAVSVPSISSINSLFPRGASGAGVPPTFYGGSRRARHPHPSRPPTPPAPRPSQAQPASGSWSDRANPEGARVIPLAAKKNHPKNQWIFNPLCS